MNTNFSIGAENINNIPTKNLTKKNNANSQKQNDLKDDKAILEAMENKGMINKLFAVTSNKPAKECPTEDAACPTCLTEPECPTEPACHARPTEPKSHMQPTEPAASPTSLMEPECPTEPEYHT